MEPTADSSRTFRAVLGITSNSHERTEVSITICGDARVGYGKSGSNYVAASSTVWAVVRSEILCFCGMVGVYPVLDSAHADGHLTFMRQALSGDGDVLGAIQR